MTLMEQLKTEMERRLNSYSNSNGNNTNNFNSNSSIAIEEDRLVDSFSDIIDPEYRVWFIKRLKVVGRQRFIEAGERARKYGNEPSRLFASLIR